MFWPLRRQRVSLWTERSGELDPLRAAMEGERAHDESARKTQAVKAGKRRQAERGEHLGGPLPLGYRGEPYLNERGDKRQRTATDPDHAPTAERIFQLAADGVPDSQLARAVNAEGYRSRAGRPFDRRAIQALVTNPFYAGLILYEGEHYEGKHPALVDRQAWRAIQAQRASRDLGAGHHAKGRNTHHHLLSRLAVCGACNAPMYAYTAPYRRKSDGGRARSYRCRSYTNSDGVCSARPVDAEAVDTAVMERLHDLLPDFEQWAGQIEDRHAAERGRMEALRDRERDGRDAQRGRLAAIEGKWADLVAGGQDADLVLPILQRERQALDDAEVRLAASEDALASIPETVAHDRLLDFALSLREAIRGRTAGAGSVETVNRALTELFSCFIIHAPWAQLPEGVGLDAGAVLVEPSIRPEVAQRMLDADWPEPPLEWIEALSADTQEYRPIPSGRALRPLVSTAFPCSGPRELG